MNITALSEPFAADDVEWRAQSTGKTRDGKPWIKVLAYINNRAIMERLDEVCGPQNWRNEYATGPHGGVLCGISILIDRDTYAEWVTKWDGAENTDIEGVKGGLSGAMKRAGYQWGIGRYLYNLEEGFGNISPNGAHYVAAKADKHGDAFKWDPPRLPAWALPGGSGKPGVVSRAQETRGEKAKAVLEQAEAAAGVRPASPQPSVAAADMKLPGTKVSLNGNGGKRIGDVGSDALETILSGLRDADAVKFSSIIEAIGEVLADRASATV